MARMEIRDVQAGPVRLAVAEAGVGGRPFLLLHGFTGAKEDFTDWLDRFASDGWWAVAPDQRGHGASDHPTSEDDYSLAQYAADALALCDALGWSSCTLLGHSMGGMIAQTIALQAPERIDALVLMDTTPGPLPLDRSQADLAIEIVRSDGVEALLAAMKAHFARAGGPLGTPAHEHLLAAKPGYAEFGDRKFLASSRAMYAAMVTEMFEQDDRCEALGAFDKPALALVGEQDTACVPETERLAKAIPGCRFEIISGGGHSPQFEAPEQWWSAVSSFLEEQR